MLDSDTVSKSSAATVMISIGDFARIGRVPARMRRHYNAIGLLSREHGDPHSGYRYDRSASNQA